MHAPCFNTRTMAHCHTAPRLHLRAAAVTRRGTMRSRMWLYSRLLWELGFQVRRVLQQWECGQDECVRSGATGGSGSGGGPQAELLRPPPRAAAHLLPPSSLIWLPDSTLLPA